MNNKNIISLRMERQFLINRANEAEYLALYRDTQPGQNVYWHGFGDPPSISFRAAFDDMEFNRERQRTRTLVKGRFQGGNLGWIESRDMELFACMCQMPLERANEAQITLLELIQRDGPLNIQVMKEMTGMLVKKITPVLHRLQTAFLIYEDQYDGEWDRGWYNFSEMFPNVNLDRYSKVEAIKIILQRFSYRHVWFNFDMAKSFYKLPGKDIKSAIAELTEKNILVSYDDGYMLKTDYEILNNRDFEAVQSIFVMHRNDFLVKSNEYWLKEKYTHPDYDILQYILVDGEFKGAVMGHFKYGPYIIEDVVVDEGILQRDEIIEAVYGVNGRDGSPIKRYCGELM